MNNQKSEPDNYLGKLLNNRYLIKKLIGQGGIGSVYLAEDIGKGGITVALKIINLHLINQNISQRFGQEISIAAQLGRKSKNIVRVLSYGITDEKVLFYVMEYLEGKNLKQILRNQPLQISKFLEISQQICLGLHCAHQGVSIKGQNYPVIHSNIKPENIFIHENSKILEIVKILDFGVAKFIIERSGVTMNDYFIASLPYCSPEHIEGRKLLDVRSDIYSLGVLMFEMLTGKHPFWAKNNSFGAWYQMHRFQAPPEFSQVNHQVEIPPQLQKLVLHCLAKDVNERPQSISAIINDLASIKTEFEQSSLGSNSNKVTSTSLVNVEPLKTLSEKECLRKIWPKNKPVSLIGFPKLLYTIQGNIPTFWAMLPKAEINKLIAKQGKNNTEFIMSQVEIYPMVLWVTLLYDDQFSLTRWLSYYLDIKELKDKEILDTLATKGYYHLLFFSIEEPTSCSHVITISLTPNQNEQLGVYVKSSQKVNTTLISSKQSKFNLKAEYEKSKVEILKKVAASQNKDLVGVKYWIAQLFKKVF
ncbi:serine/threonine-protein kinase [Cronbergia sp. UHCC 0137]|uniref:serine/threonine protein kinase n=1 Tax=Cronbergia sp. UHCC 0137 TaxID=3110239 RepID=UPI002B1E9159|nr:serine/threonine-protein kinase [Cronbergia sp. UHCC 0137]MEA5618058.1 serine/threonine-protein kinase [Cronbergia sp. UHCC 0137]